MIGVLFGALVLLIILNVPVGVALGMASTAALLFAGTMPIALISQRMYSAMDSFPLLALPFFLLAGKLMEHGGISTRLVRFASSLVGHIRAGIAMVSVVTSMFFAGISGSAVADTAAVGGVLIPAMLGKGYDKDYAAAVQATAGSIGVIIPPSVPMVIYGVTAGVSIGNLFLGGFIPGVLVGLSLMAVAYFIGGQRGYAGDPRATLAQVWQSFKESVWALVMPVIILGGILGGIFTPTEAAAIAVVYAAFVGFFVYKGLTLEKLPDILIETVVGTGTIMLIIGTASLFAWILTSARVPQMIGEAFLGISRSSTVILMLINVLLLIVGTFIETNAAIIMLAPILLPLVKTMGVDPVFFGVMMVVNLAIGMATPPVGVTLFVVCSITKRTIREIFPTVLPFLGAMIAILILITVFPSLVTFMPSVFGV
ncbi:TRAP transporter large permease [Gelria sp. Kuro-4]|uniref:TRAP transporter large permease n=1 Tax=Gelria sp. Kuro-4 TaxID=2796927 RepID=UPI001BEEB8B0|nr:TRAP transporter large permease [Gelria sp. Kuro-4]BCV24145.1 hypothetical protein kuro4_09180 [Gelria sp. Kuro-4]